MTGLQLVLAVALLTAACAGTPSQAPRPLRPAARPAATAAGAPAAPGPATPPPGATGAQASPTPAPPVASTSAPAGSPELPRPSAGPAPLPLGTVTLAGRALAPATLISDQGGSLMGDGAGRYRLAQAGLPQGPVAFARVALLDAAGQPVRGPDGAPLVTETDALGAYAFGVAIPPQHVVVTVTPRGGAGALSRVVPAGVTAADVEYASTLVTAYVLDRFVRGQPDPQATLNKLPAPVEAETVAIAARAAADTLRQSDTAFGAQLEVVKKILISAGVSNLGTGLPATEVYMRRLFASEVASDGTLYTYASDDHLIWRVGPDGRLGIAAGNGESPAPGKEPVDRTGQRAVDAALEHLWGVWCDAQGRLIVHENEHGIWRLEPDGTIRTLHAKAALEAAFPDDFMDRDVHLRADGTLVALSGQAVWALPPGGPRTKLADAGTARAVGGFAELPGGQGWLTLAWGGLTAIRPGQPNEPIFAQDDARLSKAYGQVTLDPQGNFFYVATADSKLHQRRPDGTDVALMPASALTRGLAWARQGLDGAVYLSDCNMGDNLGTAVVRRLGPGGARTLVAGVDGLPRGFTSDGRIPLAYPKGLDVAPDGTLYLADNGALLRVPPGGAPELLAAKDTVVGFLTPVAFTGVRLLPDGRLVARGLARQRELILRQATPGGAWQVVFSETTTWGNPWNVSMHAWDVAPDGTIVVSRHVYNTTANAMEVQVYRLKPGEAEASVLVPASAGLDDIGRLVFAPDGTLHLRGRKDWGDPDKTTHFIVATDGTLSAAPAGVLAAEAKDAQGRLYEGDASGYALGNYGDRRIRRQAPGQPAEVVAGQGTALLGGNTLDDSIGWAEDLRFDAAGNLYVRDVLRRQVRRIPRERL